jgi:hypothetical protein
MGRRTLGPLVERDEFVSVLGRVIPFDPDEFRDLPPPLSTLDVQQQLNGVADVGADSGVWKFNTGL